MRIALGGIWAKARRKSRSIFKGSEGMAGWLDGVKVNEREQSRLRQLKWPLV